MKKIINGKRYDTEAKHTTKVASHGDGYVGDFHHWQEDLYRTGHGNWYLVGEGGALSRYSEPVCGGGMGGTSDVVVPLTETEAQRWLEEAGETEAVEQYFGEMVVDA